MQSETLESKETSWPPAGWLTRPTAAARLDRSESCVHGMGGDDIRVMKTRNPKSGQNVVLYHEGDVERVLWQRNNPGMVTLGPESAAVEAALLAGRTPIPVIQGPPVNWAVSSLPTIRGDHERGQIGAQHSTEHYWIKEWIKPAPDSPHHKFIIAGPGTNPQRAYIALTESCGPHHIQALEAAYQAGLAAGELAPRRALWITVGEAAEYTGLPASAILKLVQSGCIPAFNVGPRPGGAWRIARAALDELEGVR